LGGPYVQQQRGHIVISVAQERFSAQWKRRGNVVVSILALLFLTILTFAGIQQALASIAVMEKSGTALNWPIPAILKSLFALSVALMTLQTLLQLGSDLKRLK
ncbi:MAG: TRAP transporter small permease subunit, partial [Burkholderiales bacterium]